MEHCDKERRPRNPRETASIFSIITFFFTHKLLKKGYKKDLEDSDIYEVLPCYSSQKLGEKLDDYWAIEVMKSEKPSLFRILRKQFGPIYLFWGMVQLCMKTASILLLPLCIGKFVAYFAPDQTNMTINDAYFYAGALVGLNLLETIYNHNYIQIVIEIGLKLRTALCGLIYRKAMRLSPGSLIDVSTGKIVTMITKDVFSIDSPLLFLNSMWVGMVQTAVICYLVYQKVGYVVFAGVGFFVAMIPVQLFFGRLISRKRLASFKLTDKRYQIIQEVLSAIKMIKMYTWEEYFLKKVSEVRKKETNLITVVYYLKATIMVLGSLASKLPFYILVMAYVMTGNYIEAETIYFIQQCFQALRQVMTLSIPMGIAQTADLIAAVGRIQTFLLSEEVKEKPPKAQLSITPNPEVLLDEVSVKIKGQEVLKSVSLKLNKGLLIITGNVGSGKTSILKTIVGDYPVSHGKLKVEGSVSYAPQNPWLFPSTIKQNVLFGQKYDETRYREVLRVCALNLDLNQFENGDNTIVSDQGVNLSKGQQARICLARAVYRKSDIYLIDDCLSPLDSRVSKSVFNDCILQFLKDKICIFVTNNIYFMKRAPGKILFVENGATLTLKQQMESLDKRITYYIDENNGGDFEIVDIDIDETDDVRLDELEPLLKHKPGKNNAKNLYHEDKRTGKVNFGVYMKYFRYAGGIWFVIGLCGLFVIAQYSIIYTDKLVSKWVDIEPNVTRLIKANLTNTTDYEIAIQARESTLNLYSVMMIVASILTLLRTFWNFHFCGVAAKRLHKALTSSILNSTMLFFDSHFIGNIINRFSKDFQLIDESIPYLVYENFYAVFTICGALLLIATVNWAFVLPCGVLLAKMYFVRKIYMPTGRSIRRLESATRSPVIGHVNATMEGITIVRAHGKQSDLISEFDRHMDVYTSAFYMMICCTRTFGFVLDVSSSFFVAAVVSYFIFMPGATAGEVGLAISQAMMLTGLLQWSIRTFSEIENNMTSVERVLEYTDIKTESKKTGQVLTNWPTKGRISYKNVCLTYRTSGEQVLKDVNFEIDSRAKIGIVGRTGAGKTSIVSSLFRLYDVQGRIFIDDEDIKTVQLKFLRSKIAIIPQDPVLFSGTIRDNIDPLRRHTDTVIWEAIGKVGMKHVVTSLNQDVKDKGNHLSIGQRQLLCLVRALISKNKIVVLDEAMANMDPDTDSMIQRIVKEQFTDCTVLTIAHRLHTIISCQKVMVVDDGKVVQYDDPKELLKDTDGLFYKMVKQAEILERLER